jgi:hypothetical protein
MIEATVIKIVNYDRKTLIVQAATGQRSNYIKYLYFQYYSKLDICGGLRRIFSCTGV